MKFITHFPRKAFLRVGVLLLSFLMANLPLLAQESGDGHHFTFEDILRRVVIASRSVKRAGLGVRSADLGRKREDSDFDFKYVPGGSIEIDSSGRRRSELRFDLKKKLRSGIEISMGPSLGKSDGGGYRSELTGSIEIPLLRGWGSEYNTHNLYLAGHEIRRRQRGQYDAVVENTLSALRFAYDIHQQDRLTEQYRQLIERLQRHVATARVREKAGLATQLDVYRAAIALKNAESRLLDILESARASQDELRRVLFIDDRLPIRVTLPLGLPDISLSVEKAVEIGLANSVALDQFRDDIKRAGRESKIARQNTRPDLRMEIGYSHADKGVFSNGVDMDESIWRLQLSSSLDLARTRERLEYQARLIDEQDLGIRLEEERNKLANTIRNQWYGIKKSMDKVRLAEEQATQTRRKQTLSKLKFDHGKATNFDLIEAEIQLNQSLANALSERVGYLLGYYEFRAKLGTLVDLPVLRQ
uniref:Outer membrane protein TolC n=1 Tax=Candidatus Kentrum sp. UNK TaxID=2126344 RepID=A0A451AYG6_9GAMM|nr:MAG: Outer membrane protein TolC [Candidatus Kentron sp. UNK]VFK71092.1 MAG: Outer membrane protein TolC [Candidatus Kentron sp. UNK]